ncbi:hypothetical protein HK415_15865 [Ramlibacter sp. B156]|uniref:Uncharacterized protein n=1 Tax=Ramlibacter montanisoli TaxID=2732512 RepID=A0A849K7G6_9BURK|nr:hypothetical protein [Ramlibacter montanisoli]
MSWSTIVLMVSFSARISPLHLHGDLGGEVSLGDGGRHAGDVAHLRGEVGRHGVHGVRQVLPGARDARHLRLTTELAFGTHFLGHARHFGREAVQLVHHRVDGFLQLQDLAAHVHRDLLGQVAAGDGRGHVRDVAHLRREVGRHEVHGVGQVLPGARHARHHGLAAETPVGAHLARHARHFRGEGAQLVHHGVGCFLQLQDLAAHVHRDLLGQVAVGDRDGHVGDVAHLRREVAGHLVHRVGEVFPHARHALHLGLAAQLAFGAHFARHPRHLRGEHGQLLDHRVHQLGGAQELALEVPTVHLKLHRLAQVALGHRADGAGDVGRRPHQVVDQGVERVHLRRPAAQRAGRGNPLRQAPFLADGVGHARRFAGDAVGVGNGLVEGLRDPRIDAGPFGRQADAEVPRGEGHERGQHLARTRLGHFGRKGVDGGIWTGAAALAGPGALAVFARAEGLADFFLVDAVTAWSMEAPYSCAARQVSTRTSNAVVGRRRHSELKAEQAAELWRINGPTAASAR